MSAKQTPRVSRPSINLDDRARLLELLNIGNIPMISFTVIAHRCVEALVAFIAADTTGVMEQLTQKWATEEANAAHEAEN